MTKTSLGTALVTGASSGIGYATAKALQVAGFRVFGTSRSAAVESPDGVTMLTCDVTDDASVAKLVEDVLAKWGRIDLLVNNAGVDLFGGAEESSAAQAQIDDPALPLAAHDRQHRVGHADHAEAIPASGARAVPRAGGPAIPPPA